MRMLVQAEGSVGFFHPASVYGMKHGIGLSQDLGHVAFSSARPGGASGRLVQGQLGRLLLPRAALSWREAAGEEGRWLSPAKRAVPVLSVQKALLPAASPRWAAWVALSCVELEGAAPSSGITFASALASSSVGSGGVGRACDLHSVQYGGQ